MTEKYFKADKDNHSPYEDESYVSPFDEAASQGEERTIDDYKMDLYEYVGAYFGWSWKEFEETPPHITKKFKERLDKKFANTDEEIFSYQYLAILMALAKAFGGK